MIDVPWVRSLSTVTTPRRRFTVNATELSPSPVPVGFVVKNGSNMWALASGVSPLPVSVTINLACGPTTAV